MAQKRYRTRTAADIEIKYKDFLDGLRAMPAGTREAREVRQQYIKEYKNLSEFVEDLLYAYKPSSFQKLLSHLGQDFAVGEDHSYDENSDDSDSLDEYEEPSSSSGYTQGSLQDSLWSSYQTDPGIFYEAILSAASRYTGSDQNGKYVPFLASVGLQNRQLSVTQYAKETSPVSGMLPKSKEEKAASVYKLAANVRDLKESGIYVSFEKALDSIETAPWVSGRIKDTILMIASGQHQAAALDRAVNDDGADTTMGELLADSKDAYNEVIEKDAMGTALKGFFYYWDDMGSLFKKREKDCARLFLTKDILQPLKTDEKGESFHSEPAGNPDVYEALSPYEGTVYGKIFYMDYVDYAITGQPSDLYDVYANLLRDGFRFTDKEIADALGRDKSYVSKKRTMYQSIQSRMLDYCKTVGVMD